MPPGAHGSSLGTPTRLSGAPVVKWLLIINVAVWLLEMMTNNAPVPPAGYQRGHDSLLWNWGHFSVGFAVEQFQIWRFFTFQFLHANGHHLLVNMLGLFFFGHFCERWWGSRKFLFFYLSTGVAGALFYVILFYLGWFGSDPIPSRSGEMVLSFLHGDDRCLCGHLWYSGRCCHHRAESAGIAFLFHPDEHAHLCHPGLVHQCGGHQPLI